MQTDAIVAWIDIIGTTRALRRMAAAIHSSPAVFFVP
jgi:hypothetical protein